ncbi:MAG: AMP-binding protein, partial [Phycisphaeraceae bacterium]|nr:AMP-binding protein [Phycisphaeraceae bacterium]
MQDPNLSSMHRQVAQRLGDKTAIRHKVGDDWAQVSWRQYRRAADTAARALMDAGVGPGDRVAVLSENRFEWLAADLAVQAAGGISVPMHAPLAPPQVAYQL